MSKLTLYLLNTAFFFLWTVLWFVVLPFVFKTLWSELPADMVVGFAFLWAISGVAYLIASYDIVQSRL